LIKALKERGGGTTQPSLLPVDWGKDAGGIREGKKMSSRGGGDM